MSSDHKKKPANVADAAVLQQQVEALTAQLAAAQETERRALADYANLVRRTQEDRIRWVKLAAVELVQSLLPTFWHLDLAEKQLQDKGLSMIMAQFWQTLQQQGVTEIKCEGKPFDPTLMEVVGREEVTDPNQVDMVLRVTRRGFHLSGEVVAHAQVIVGVMTGGTTAAQSGPPPGVSEEKV